MKLDFCFISKVYFLHSSSLKICCAQLFSHVWLFVAPWTIAHQAPPSMGFSRQEYYSGLPFPTPGNLPDPVIKSMRSRPLASPALACRFFMTSATWEGPPKKRWKEENLGDGREMKKEEKEKEGGGERRRGNKANRLGWWDALSYHFLMTELTT